MPLEIRVSHQETFMSAKVSGRASMQDVRNMLETLSDESMRMNATRILVDLVHVEENFNFADHVTIGTQAVTDLYHLEKIATLVATGRKRGASEEAARQRGVALRTFTSSNEAIEWLEAW